LSQGPYLRESIESVGTPTRAVEVVVVHDGSTGATADVADSIARRDGHVRVVRGPNAGVAAARNRGLEESLGRYIVFLDAGDRLAPGALDLGARTCDAHPESAFVFGRCRMMSAAGELLPTSLRPRIERGHYLGLLRRNFIWTPATVMFRRDAVEQAGGFDPTANASADYDLYLRLARNYPVHDHGRIVAHYRRNPSSMSGGAARMLRETLAVLQAQQPFVDADPDAATAYREGWRNWQEFYGDQLVTEIRANARDGDWLAVTRKAAALGMLHPRGLVHHAQRELALTLGVLKVRIMNAELRTGGARIKAK
jgi:glycosyltransferase involved in cell wall biosynthesis